jgi:hypothetical protein
VKTAGHAATIVVGRLQVFWPLHHLLVAGHRGLNLQLQVPSYCLPSLSSASKSVRLLIQVAAAPDAVAGTEADDMHGWGRFSTKLMPHQLTFVQHQSPHQSLILADPRMKLANVL